jgi:cytidine deaminase
MDKKELMEVAKKASENAYAPFSNFKLGAALETESGKVFTGVNVENSSYGLTNCAERTAIFKAVSEGEKEFKRLVIYVDSDKLFPPCGACRQVISEFSNDLPIIIFSNKDVVETNIKELLPMSFQLDS